MQKDYYKNQSSDQTTLLKFSNDFLTPLIGFVSRWNNAANVLALSGGDRFFNPNRWKFMSSFTGSTRSFKIYSKIRVQFFLSRTTYFSDRYKLKEVCRTDVKLGAKTKLVFFYRQSLFSLPKKQYSLTLNSSHFSAGFLRAKIS